MIKYLNKEKDFNEYLERIVVHYVDFYKNAPWSINREPEKVEEYFRHVLLLPIHSFWVELSEKDEVSGFLMAYPANFTIHFSSQENSDVSLSIDLTSESEELWSVFIEKIKESPFTALLSLSIGGTRIYSFLEKNNFRNIGDYKGPANKNQCRLIIMKKVL